MIKKLNSFILPDEVAKEMIIKLREGQLKEIELGFSLCKAQNRDILKIGEHCTGGECSISTPSTCKGNDIYVGAYHTHHHESSRPSSQDIPVIYNRGFACIGGIESHKEEIKCYIRSTPKDIEDIYRFKDRLAFIIDRTEKRKEIDKFIKNNFRVIDILRNNNI
jgi:hypothetical protein